MKRRRLLVLGLALALLSLISSAAPQPVAATPPAPTASTRAALLDELTTQTGGRLSIAYDHDTGLVQFLGSDLDHPMHRPAQPSLAGTSEKAARAYLASYGGLFGLGDQAVELALERSAATDRGRTFVRFQQVAAGIPVLGGELIVQTDANQDVVSANGVILPDPAPPSASPRSSAGAAQRSALQGVAKELAVPVGALIASEPALWFYNPLLLGGPGPRVTRLVWRLEVTGNEPPVRRFVLVDAQVGTVALQFDELETAKNRQIYDNQNLTTWNPMLPGHGPVRVEGQGPTGVADVDLAYDYAGDFYDFYFARLGRDSIDNAGMPLISTVRYCPVGETCPYDNAFWNGVQMVYGQGYSVAVDVVGHEMTHGVTDYESRLFYYYQSGAINESLSDIFGNFIQHDKYAGDSQWLVGENLAIGAIRSMSNPTAYGQPDRMSSGDYTCDTALLDNGAVHVNSGVGNKAAYLLAVGGAFNGQTITGLGITKAAKIFYEAQVHLLTSASDYAMLAGALPQACTNLLGTSGITQTDCQQVAKVVTAVEMAQEPAGCATNQAPVCPSGQTPTDLFSDDLEDTSSGNWTAVTISGASGWYYPQNANPYDFDATYGTSGNINFWGYDQPTATDSAMQMTRDVALPGGSQPYFRFNHAYFFEGQGIQWDGGVVEYSLDGDLNWQDAGPLITDGGYTGPIKDTYGNPLGGRQGFGLQSFGYISSRLDLSSLAGQNVRFRFRIGTDMSTDFLGWFIDDVRVYTCQPATPIADLSIVKTVTGETFAPGEPVNFTLTVANNGTATGGSIRITDTMPAEVLNTSQSSSLPGLSLVPGTNYVWQLDALAAGASGTITIKGTLSPGLPVHYHFANTAAVGVAEDPTPEDDHDSANVPPGYPAYLPAILNRFPLYPDAPVMNPISNPGAARSYSVNWNGAAYAQTYTLQENGVTVYGPGLSFSWGASNKANGTYCYRVKAGNAVGDSAWSSPNQCTTVNAQGNWPNTGYWNGGWMEFYVVNAAPPQVIDAFAIGVNVTDCGDYTISHLPQVAVSNGHFSFSGPFWASGSFSSGSGASGSAGLTDFYIPDCGYVNGSAPWSAIWQSGTQQLAPLTASPEPVDQVTPRSTPGGFTVQPSDDPSH